MTPKTSADMPEAWSFSAVDQYDQCPRKFYYDRVLRLAPESTMGQLPGLVVHHALQHLMDPTRETGSEFTPTHFAINAVQEHISSLVRCGINTDDLLYEVKTNITRVRTFLDQAKVRCTERRFLWCGYVGYIDMTLENSPVVSKDGKEIEKWEDQPCVLDYKVVSSHRSRSQRDADLSPQLALYGPLASDISRAGFLEIPRDTEKPLKIRMTEYTRSDIDKWRRWFDGQAMAIEKQWSSHHDEVSAWPRCSRKSALCSPMWCQHWDRCYGPLPKSEA